MFSQIAGDVDRGEKDAIRMILQAVIASKSSNAILKMIALQSPVIDKEIERLGGLRGVYNTIFPDVIEESTFDYLTRMNIDATPAENDWRAFFRGGNQEEAILNLMIYTASLKRETDVLSTSIFKSVFKYVDYYVPYLTPKLFSPETINYYKEGRHAGKLDVYMYFIWKRFMEASIDIYYGHGILLYDSPIGDINEETTASLDAIYYKECLQVQKLMQKVARVAHEIRADPKLDAIDASCTVGECDSQSTTKCSLCGAVVCSTTCMDTHVRDCH